MIFKIGNLKNYYKIDKSQTFLIRKMIVVCRSSQLTYVVPLTHDVNLAVWCVSSAEFRKSDKTIYIFQKSGEKVHRIRKAIDVIIHIANKMFRGEIAKNDGASSK